MTYATFETSVSSGQPVEMYEFLSGAVYYRYTSADADVTYGGNVYTAAPISRGSIEATVETARLALELTCDRSLPVLALFSFMPPEGVVTLTLRRLHLGDTDAVVMWMGRILNVTFTPVSAEVHCESVYTSLKRTGLRRMYQKTCPHVLYGPGCKLNRATFSVARTIATITGTTITVTSMSGYANGYFSGGYMEWERTTGVFERRMVREQSGTTVVISFPIPGMVNGNSITLYPGCDHNLSTCGSKFANRLNYGGQPYYPDKNPFNSVALY